MKERPKSLREARDGRYTQEQLGGAVGVTRQAVVAWEAGQRPSGPSLRMIAMLLDQPLDVVESWWPEAKPEAA